MLALANRLAEAEPLMRRHVVIFRRSGETVGHEHPHMQAALTNYRSLLEAMGHSESEIAERMAALS
jgi:hypothetical protein